MLGCLMVVAAPQISYPPELPVSARRHDLLDAIRENQVVIVAGETGSGKTTQLPKICLELGRTSIAHTQPRRIAARTAAERIADERRRRQQARDELSHLARLADALSVQAEAVSRQCDVIARVLLPAEEAARTADEGGRPEERTTPGGGGGPKGAQTRTEGDDSAHSADRLPSEWVEAYRMRLAGAKRGEVEGYLRRNGVEDASRVTSEVFKDA